MATAIDSETSTANPVGTSVELSDLTLTIGGRPLLEHASARFEPGKVTLIVGGSGVGKSLLLRALARLADTIPEFNAHGDIRFLGPNKRKTEQPHVGVVFQNFALFDELSPKGNVRLALDHSRRVDGTHRIAANPDQLLSELNVPTHVRTSMLSGGQKQRLAIARTLAYDPDVVLYDEPTSGLDPSTASQVASLIGRTHQSHPATSIIVTHDYEALAPIADAVFLFDAESKSLVEIDVGEIDSLGDRLQSPPITVPINEPQNAISLATQTTSNLLTYCGDFFANTTRAIEAAAVAPFRLLPLWKSPKWGLRYLAHYLRLVAGPSAWIYIAIAGLIIGFVATHFTFRFLPYANYTEPLLVEDLLSSMGFALYRILVPILATILIAARCGAAVASDVGGKTYGQQIAALKTLGISPANYLQTGILYAFLIGTPLLTAVGFLVAKMTSVVVFAATHPAYGPEFWRLHFHDQLTIPGQFWYAGTGWLLAKLLLCGTGIATIAFYQGTRRKLSSEHVSGGITSTILFSTLFVLTVHFGFTFFEFK